ncbi:MAG TPA: hypothetical protein VGR51_09820 [Thermoplasmata archaeon]|nr:hypothetical protein [Thermoplasmata archaeon]
MTAFAVVALATVFFGSTATGATPPNAGLRVYANDRLWASFDATDLKPGPAKSMDLIFVFPGTSLMPVAEASPGDPDYNGGRWEVHAVTFTGIAPEQFTNDEQVWFHYGLGHLSISGVLRTFECPLIPL